MAERKRYTWEIATNSGRGLFRVGDRDFVDQDFTRSEKAAVLTELGNPEAIEYVPLVLAVLNRRRTDEQALPVDAAWLDTQVSERALADLYARLLTLIQGTSEQPG
jgi:hypothetical protein